MDQHSISANPDARFIQSTVDFSSHRLLSEFVELRQGLTTGDLPRFVRYFWEVDGFASGWVRFHQPTDGPEWEDRSTALLWENGTGSLQKFSIERGQMTSWRGRDLWGSTGVLLGQMTLKPAIYTGDKYPDTCVAMVPNRAEDLGALFAFLSSEEYRRVVRTVDQSLKIPAATTAKVPFDAERWRALAKDVPLDTSGHRSPNPTQWTHTGDPVHSFRPLQVATARLLGFRWPQQGDAGQLDALADSDGVACVPSVAGEPPAEDRLAGLLSTALGGAWNASEEARGLKEEGGRQKGISEWLRDGFFESHCKLFKNRPFIWHIWDGRKDGFAALVNYHKLDRANLERLTYTYLGDWIERQTAGVRDDLAGAEDRLAAAKELQRKLELILEGEPPYDIYVRWKPLHEQPIGWDPDLNDGVRLNIRPFVEAGILRKKPNIHWKKDRGKNPDGSERHNDLHYTNAEILAARKEAGL